MSGGHHGAGSDEIPAQDEPIDENVNIAEKTIMKIADRVFRACFVGQSSASYMADQYNDLTRLIISTHHSVLSSEKWEYVSKTMEDAKHHLGNLQGLVEKAQEARENPGYA
jgi:hypothetical protein